MIHFFRPVVSSTMSPVWTWLHTSTKNHQNTSWLKHTETSNTFKRSSIESLFYNAIIFIDLKVSEDFLDGLHDLSSPSDPWAHPPPSFIFQICIQTHSQRHWLQGSAALPTEGQKHGNDWLSARQTQTSVGVAQLSSVSRINHIIIHLNKIWWFAKK